MLEDRTVPAATVYLDFGLGFPASPTFPGGRLTVSDSDMSDSGINGPRVFGAGHTVISLTQTVMNRQIDLNGDGLFNQQDAQILANQVVPIVQRTFEPFDIDVQMRSAANLDDVRNSLASTGTRDAYVFVAGSSPPPPWRAFGWAQRDEGNTQDNLAFAFANELIDTYGVGSAVFAMATVAAHEAGHTFGLKHANAGILLGSGDEMGHPVGGVDLRRFDVVNLFTRFPVPLAPEDGVGTQNAYDLLAVPTTVGLRPGAPAYVTGTGAHDRITITRLGPAQAAVRVEAFANPDLTGLISAFNYVVPTANGILVEAGVNDDRIILDGDLETTVRVRSGAETDTVIVNALNGDRLVTMTQTQVTVGNTVVLYDDAVETEQLTVNTGDGNDTITIVNTTDSMTVTVNAGAGDDTITILNTAARQPVTVNADAGDDTVNIRRIEIGASVTVNTGAGNADRVNVGNALGRLDEIIGALTVVGEAGGNSSLVLNDTGPGFEVYTITNQSVKAARLPAAIFYNSVQSVTLTGGPDQEAFNVLSTAAGTSVTYNAGGGDDQITVGSAANALDQIQGALIINGQGGNDRLTIKDQGTAAAQTYRITPSSVTRVGGPPITYRTPDGAVENLTLNGGSGGNRIEVQGAAAGTTVIVNAGAGNDTILAGDAVDMLDPIRGRVEVHGQAGNNTLTVNDQGAPVGRTYGIGFITVEVTELPNLFIRYDGLQGLTLNAASAPGGVGNTVNVFGTEVGTPVTVNAGMGNDTIRLGTFDGSLFSLRSAVTVHGQLGNDTLILRDDDPRFPVGDVYTIRATEVRLLTLPNAPITYHTVEGLTLHGSAGGNIVNVLGTAAGTSVTVNAGADNDVVHIGSDPGGADQVLSAVTVNGQTGNDTVNVRRTVAGASVTVNGGDGDDTVNVGSTANRLDSVRGTVTVNGDLGANDQLNLNDQDFPGADTYTITNNTVRAAALPDLLIRYFTLDRLTLNAAAGGNNTVNVLSTAAGTSATINTGVGDDTVNVGSGTGSLDGMQGAVHVDAGAGFDRLNLNDQGRAAGEAYAMTSSRLDVARLPNSPITYFGVERLTLNSSSGNDDISVLNSLSSTLVRVNAGTGNDFVAVGNGITGLGMIRGSVVVDGEVGNDTLAIIDSSALVGDTYTIRAEDVLVASNPALWIVYGNLEDLVVNAGLGSDLIHVVGAPAGTRVTVNGGAGNDTLLGPNAANTWDITPNNAGILNSIVTFSLVEGLTGGSSTDVFVFGNGQGVSGHINGGAGIDTLNYSAYTTPVVVNLLAGTATNVGGGISNIENAVLPSLVSRPPVITPQTFTLAENSPNGTVVGTVVATDPDIGQTLTYAITAGNPSGAFAINATTGRLTVANTSALNFEVTPTFSLTVRVTDSGTPALSSSATVTVNLTNVNEAPVIASQIFTVAENSPNGTVVGTVAASDPDAMSTLTYAVTAGNPSGAFAINAATGQLRVANSAALNFEVTPTFSLTVRVTDNGSPALSSSATVTVNLTNVNEAPTDIALSNASVAENQPVGTVVGTFSTTDPDAGNTHTYSLSRFR